MKISIIGTGYVGLVSGACFADLGHSVVCLDKDKTKIKSLSQGNSSIYEPGLDEILKRNIQSKRLSFTTSYKIACQADLLILCIDTPAKKAGEPNLANLKLSLKSISAELKKEIFIVTKSTVPIGTNQYIKDFIENNTGFKVNIISNPEFLKEGCAVQDFFSPSRIVIGCESNASRKVMKELYDPLKLPNKQFIYMKVQSAELTKYASNSFLATKISFINKISQIAEYANADIHEIKRGIGSDSRIGNEFLNAGLGYGGSCFPKDIKALINFEKKFKIDHSLFSAVEEINNQQFTLFYKKIIDAIGQKRLKHSSFVIWGLSFKPNTNDVRDSIALRLIHQLADQVKHLYLYDPEAIRESSVHLNQYNNITYCKNAYEHMQSANALILCTEWLEFQNPQMNMLNCLKDKKIFDGRNFLDKEIILKAGIEYFGLGR